MTENSLSELETIQGYDTTQLLNIVLKEGIELVHTAGLLAEELHEYSLDFASLTEEELRKVSGYLVEELTRYRRVVESAVVNRALLDTAEAQVFVIERDDSLGVYLGETLTEDHEVPVSGRTGGWSLTLKKGTEKGAKIALKDLKKDDDLRFYGMSIGKATDDLSAGSPIA